METRSISTSSLHTEMHSCIHASNHAVHKSLQVGPQKAPGDVGLVAGPEGLLLYGIRTLT